MRIFALALLGSTALIATAANAQTNPAPQPNTTAPQTATQPLTASLLRDKVIYSQTGQEFGRVTSVLRGGNDQTFVVVTMAGNRQVLVPTDRMAFENNRYVVRGDEAQLRGLTEYREGVGSYRPVQPNERITIAGAPSAQQTAQAGQTAAGEASRIVVQQPAPGIRVEQASPQVRVQQPQPQVTVRQPQPEILVRQPAPTVTVDIPQPEITVRMPPPDVNVAQAQPQVQVRQPQPQVQVVQPERQAQVQVQRAQPQVDVQQPANAQANVQVQRTEGQPQVRYERAEPKVTVNQAQGQPRVRVEPMDPAQQAATGAGPNRQRQAVRTEEQRRAYQQRFGDDPAATTGTVAPAQNAPTRAIRISDIDDMNVYNGRGERLGEVERVVMSTADNKRYLIVAHGGFLGLGEDRVAFPVERFAVSGNDQLVIRGVTADDIEAMDNWRNRVAEYSNLGEADQVNLVVLQ